jgi:hypothetical protein
MKIAGRGIMSWVAGAAETARRTVFGQARNIAIAVLVGVLLAFAGPFGSFDAPLANRLVFWVPLLVAGTACAAALQVATRARPRAGANPAVRWALFSAGVAAPMSILSWGLARLVFGPSASADAWSFIWPTVLISGAMTALFMSHNAPGPQTHAAPGGGANIRLRERLPASLRSAEILAVSAEDHYLRVHTSGGSTLILLRLSDAVEELEGIEGAQVHRSWWVSRAAIVEPRRSGRNVSLAVKGDLLVPVSRPNVRALQESGWL